jgi:hypothetical protein
LGNPYNYFSYFRQEIIFDISNISSLENYELYFYSQGNFYDHENNQINSGILEIKNINLFYGPSAQEYKNSENKKEFVIYSLDNNEYNDTDKTQISIGSKWVREREDEPGTYETIENGVNAGEGVTYDIYRYTVGCENVGAGPHWAKVLSKDEKPWLFDNTKETEFQTKIDGTITKINCPEVKVLGGTEKFKAIINKVKEIKESDPIIQEITLTKSTSFFLGNKNIVPGTIAITSDDALVEFDSNTNIIRFNDAEGASGVIINYEQGIIKDDRGKAFFDGDGTEKVVKLKITYQYLSIKDLTSNILNFDAIGDNVGKTEVTSEISLSFLSTDKY